ncbi:MAG: GNAT family N-acetyltransferase [Acidobacteria bacterium]|nr:GNAT family N-acetyltransferase [Acidobacteriota bacterium]
MSSALHAKPVVLRCSRCGRFVDWEDARLQVVDACRPRLDLPPVLVRESSEADRVGALDLFQRDFGHTNVIAFGEVMLLDRAGLLVVELKDEIAGALAHRLLPEALQIVALATDPMWQRSGVGGYLVAEAELLARRKNRHRVVVATTNDNLPALYFYQRRGYRITEVVPGGLLRDASETPTSGFGGIPMRDEVRLERRL